MFPTKRCSAAIFAAFAFIAGTITPLSAATLADFEVFPTLKGIKNYSDSFVDGPVTISALNASYLVAYDRGLQSGGLTAVGMRNGANGAGIRFSFSETLVAQSFDVSAWLIGNTGMPDATVTSSAGGSFTIPFGTTGTFDLTAQPNFDGIDWIDIRLPTPTSTCVILFTGSSLNCSTMFIDRMIVSAAPPPPPPPALIPLPAGLPFLAAALGLLRLLPRRRRT